MLELRAIVLFALVSSGYAPPVDGTGDNSPNAETSVLELVKRLDSDVKRLYFFESFDSKNEFESLLQEIIKHGRKAERPLLFKLKQDSFKLAHAQKQLKKLKESDEFFFNDAYNKVYREVDRLSNNLELLTALRRVQKKPDPLSIRVTPPKDLKAIPGRLPSFSATLESVDIEQKPIWVQQIPHFHGTRREAQWRFDTNGTAGVQGPYLRRRPRDRNRRQ